MEKQILNLTQHPATEEQKDAGVIEPKDKKKIQGLLTFERKPSIDEISERADKLARIALMSGCKKAMIGGAPFLMPSLAFYIKRSGIQPVCAFSKRESVEKEVGGKIKKVSVFKHLGFTEAL